MPTKDEFTALLGNCHWMTVRHISQMLGIPTPLFGAEYRFDAEILDLYDKTSGKVWTAYLLNRAIRNRRVSDMEKVFPYLCKAVSAGLTVSTPQGAFFTVIKAIFATLSKAN